MYLPLTVNLWEMMREIHLIVVTCPLMIQAGHHSVSSIIKEKECIFTLHVFIDGRHCKTLIGAVDYSWLFTYAIFLFVRYSDILTYITVNVLYVGVFVGTMCKALAVYSRSYVTLHAVLLLSITVQLFNATLLKCTVVRCAGV